jgi:hypothetical protein
VHAAGIYCLEAAVRLLTGHRGWLHREDFLAAFVRVDVGEAGMFACVDWLAVVAALGAGRPPCSSGERAILLPAAGIAEGVPVDPRDALTALDGAHAALVADVVLHAAGDPRGAVTLGGTSR